MSEPQVAAAQSTVGEPEVIVADSADPFVPGSVPARILLIT